MVASASGLSYSIRANAMGGGTSLFYIMFIFIRDDLKQICQNIRKLPNF